MEQLEQRALFSVFTAQEVYFNELVNRARANPMAEGTRLGVNLSAGLTIGEQALLVAREPLALNPALTLAARAHALDMPTRGFFDHVNPSGFSPTQRAIGQGYQGSAGENIGAGYASIDALYAAWMTMPSERKNILSLYPLFDSTYHYDHIGPGFAWNITGAAHSSYFTVDFGNPSQTVRTQWLTGVVFTDSDLNSFYGIGEGLGGVLISVYAGGAATGTPVQTFTTDEAGNYQLPLANGAYTVVFSQVGTNKSVAKQVTISGQNAKLDAKASELVAPVPPPPVDADEKYLLSDDAQTLAATLAAGRSAVAFVNQFGTPYYAERSASGVWTGVNLSTVPGAVAVTGDLSMWIDRKDSLTYIAARAAGSNKLLVFTRSSTGVWSVRNLTTEIKVSRPIVSTLAIFHDGEGLTQISGLAADGALVTYWQTGAKLANGKWRWFYTNIAERDLARRGRPMPTLTADLTTYVTQRNSLNVVGTDASGNVWLFFRPGGGKATQLWNYVNITAQTGAASFAGLPTAYETTNRVVQITGTDLGGNLWSISWRSGEGWRSRNVTASLGGAPALRTTGLGSYANKGGVGFSVGVTSSGEIILYRYQFKNGQDTWAYASVSAAISDSSAPSIEGVVTARFDNGAISLSARTADDHVWRIAFTPAAGWTAEDASIGLSV